MALAGQGALADAGVDSSALDAGALGACAYPRSPAGKRMFGGDILDVNAGEAFSDNVAELAALHAGYLTLHLPWTALEATAGSGSTSGTLADPGSPPVLATFNDLAKSTGLKIALTLRPIDATGKTVPPDLASTRMNAPAMIARANQLVDFVLSKLEPANLVSLMIGNEIDGYDTGGDAAFWSDYAELLAAVTAHVHAAHPELAVGFTATLSAWTDAARSLDGTLPARMTLQRLAQGCDAVGVTYYPLNGDFTMRAPGVVAADLAALVDAVPADKPIHVQEIGYASSPVTASSDAQQADFYCEAMHVWDTHADRIPRMAFLRLNDVTADKAKELAGPYGVGPPAFVEYLRTLGLRTESGEPKPARTLLEQELTARGF